MDRSDQWLGSCRGHDLKFPAGSLGALGSIGRSWTMQVREHDLKIFSTCPLSARANPKTCAGELREFARASEDAGHEGMLVVTDNGQLDPWLVSQIIVESTQRLSPLV